MESALSGFFSISCAFPLRAVSGSGMWILPVHMARLFDNFVLNAVCVFSLFSLGLIWAALWYVYRHMLGEHCHSGPVHKGPHWLQR